jgi:hypothetical protein
MNVYQRGKIYKIWSPSNDQIYIGSTAEPILARRMAVHKCQHRAYQRGIGCYVSVYPLLELPDVQIALVENYPCNTKDELHARKQFYMDANRDKIINRQGAIAQPIPRFQCECGQVIQGSQSKINQHLQTKKHKRFKKQAINAPNQELL